MKKLIIIGTMTLMLTATSSVFGINEEVESRLLAKALMEGATTSEQRSAVATYFQTIAADKREEAKKLRLLANTSRGGKVASQSAQKKDYLKKADSLEKEAKAFDKIVAEAGLETTDSVAAK